MPASYVQPSNTVFDLSPQSNFAPTQQLPIVVFPQPHPVKSRKWTLVLLIAAILVVIALIAFATLPILRAQFFGPQANGAITLHIDSIGNDARQAELASFMAVGNKVLHDYAGPAWYHLDVTVSLSDDLINGENGAFVTDPRLGCSAPTAKAHIYIARANADNLNAYLHELAHAYNACWILADRRWEEGLAVYLAQVQESFIYAFSKPTPDQINYWHIGTYNGLGAFSNDFLAANNQPALSVSDPESFNATNGGPLASIQYWMLGSEFSHYDRTNHNEFAATNQGSFVKALREVIRRDWKWYRHTPDLPSLAEQISPGFKQWYATQAIFTSYSAQGPSLVLIVFPDNQNRPAHAMIVASSSKLGSKPTALASHHLEFTYVVPGQSPHQSFLTTSDEGVAVADLLPPPNCADGLTLSVLDTDARLRVELILRPPGSLQLRGAGCN